MKIINKWTNIANTSAGQAGKTAHTIVSALTAIKDIGSSTTRSALALARTLNLDCKPVLGEWNGYGYTRLGTAIEFSENSKSVLENYLKTNLKEFKKLKIKPRKETNRADATTLWVNRLHKLTNCGIEVATKIAKEKLVAKDDGIYAMYQRQEKGISTRRGKIIDAMERANPLRRIVDLDHANNILGASYRHTQTDYNNQLDEAREQAQLGNIEYSEIQQTAREKIK